MGEIRSACRRLQGTLSYYFKSKEDLCEAIVEKAGRQQAEQIFALDSNSAPSRGGADAAGHRVRALLSRPEGISPLAP